MGVSTVTCFAVEVSVIETAQQEAQASDAGNHTISAIKHAVSARMDFFTVARITLNLT